MLTLPVVLSLLGLVLAYCVFQFGLFKWLIGRIDLVGTVFQAELVRHQQADLEALKEIRSELQSLSKPSRSNTRKRAS